MGLAKSINRRMMLVRDEDFRTALKVLLARRNKRRQFELEKFGRYLTEAGLGQDDTNAAEFFAASASSHLDREWYAQVNGLPSAKDALSHYKSDGVKFALAPFKELAAEDGKTLSMWGIEYLVRMGFPLGDTGDQPLRPDDRRALDPFSLTNSNKKRIAVVTAIFGQFDSLVPIDPAWKETADFFVFSDRAYDATGGWQQVHAPFHHADTRRKARFTKLNLPAFFSDYEWVIWIDGNIMMCHGPEDILNSLDPESFDFATFRHPDRQGLMAEAAKCVQLAKDDLRTMALHLSQNQSHPAFRDTDLYETMVMVLRPSSSKVRQMCNSWWRMLARGSKRDQVSLPLAIAETPDLRVKHLPGDMRSSAYFARTRHRA